MLIKFKKARIPQKLVSLLTNRETQVMSMIIKGYKSHDICDKLHLSIKTISTFRTRIFKKMKVKNDVQLTLLALSSGILNFKK